MNGIVYERLPHKPADGALVQAYGRMEFWRARGRSACGSSAWSWRGGAAAGAGGGCARLAAEGLLDPGRKRRRRCCPAGSAS